MITVFIIGPTTPFIGWITLAIRALSTTQQWLSFGERWQCAWPMLMLCPFDYTDYGTQIRDFFTEALKLAKQRKLDSSLDTQSFLDTVDSFTKEATRIEALRRNAIAENANSVRLRSINDLLIQIEREFTDERGLRGRSWYKHQIYAPGIYTGYAAQPLTDFRQAIDDRNSTNAKESLERIAEAIKRATNKLKTVRD